VTATVVVALVLGVPALAFAIWPLFGRRSTGRGFLALPVDPRQQMEEEKQTALRALRELEFEHDAGHISEDDYASLRARYEQEVAAVLSELDRLGPSAPPGPALRLEREAGSPADTVTRGWRHPAALSVAAIVLLIFGITLGVGIVRYAEPDRMAATPVPGAATVAAPAPGAPRATPIPPEVLERMLSAARTALFEGRYGEAMSAYQAVLKRYPQNVDAITHLGLILALGGGAEHADRALETFDRALAIDPTYAPALFYRGQVLHDVKKDVPGAIRAWEQYLAVAPQGQERERVEKLIRDAKAAR